MLNCCLPWSLAGILQAIKTVVSLWVLCAQKILFAPVLPDLWLAIFWPFLPLWSLSFEGRGGCKYPIYGCTFSGYLFSALWPVVNFWTNYHLLYKEISLLRTETYNNLKAKKYEFRRQIHQYHKNPDTFSLTLGPRQEHLLSPFLLNIILENPN